MLGNHHHSQRSASNITLNCTKKYHICVIVMCNDVRCDYTNIQTLYEQCRWIINILFFAAANVHIYFLRYFKSRVYKQFVNNARMEYTWVSLRVFLESGRSGRRSNCNTQDTSISRFHVLCWTTHWDVRGHCYRRVCMCYCADILIGSFNIYLLCRFCE